MSSEKGIFGEKDKFRIYFNDIGKIMNEKFSFESFSIRRIL
jgi:hypothetical protein